MAQSPKISEGGAWLSSKVRPPSMKLVQPIWSQPPAWQWRWKQSPMLDGFKRPQLGHAYHPPHRFNELATNSDKWNGKPRHWHPPWKTPALDMWEWMGTSKQTGRHSNHPKQRVDTAVKERQFTKCDWARGALRAVFKGEEEASDWWSVWGRLFQTDWPSVWKRSFTSFCCCLHERWHR